ncbi:MAG: FGGY family carbohydrate kinase [Firmicutes bacterium]|nr:FGGY family carbohydrate kinase [Bacillota bacterium]
MAVYLGVDLGTTHIKAMAWDTKMNKAFPMASSPTPWRHGAAQTMTGDALYETALRVMHEALSALPSPRAPLAIAVASLGESGLYVDGGGQSLGPIVGWLDTRGTVKAFDDLMGRYPASTLFRRTGMSPEPKYGLFRMRVQYPPAHKYKGAYWLQLADYLIWRLSGGVRVTHASLAARTMAFDLQRHVWDAELLDFAGLTPADLPEIRWTAEPAGSVRGISPHLDGAQLVVAGHDHAVAAYGARLGPHDILDSSGTGEALVVIGVSPIFTEEALRIGTMWQPALADSQEHAIGGLVRIDGGGAAEKWARSLFGITLDDDLILPAVHPTFNVEGFGFGEAAFTHLDANSRGEALYAAVLDGVAEHIRSRIDATEVMLGKRFSDVVVAGGVLHHQLWLRRRRVIGGRPFRLMEPGEGALFGAVRWAVRTAGRDVPPEPELRVL